MTREELLRSVQLLGQRKHGVVTAERLRLAGATTKAVTAAVRAGDLERPVKAIYFPGGRQVTEQVKAHVAIAHAGDGAVLTGLVGARWCGLRWVPASVQVQVLIPPERRRRGTESFVLVRRCSWIGELETVQLYGVQVAPIAQLVVDGARECRSLQDVRGLLLGAVADKRCTVEQVRAILERSAPAGTAWLRRACLDAERGATSPPEAELVDAMLGRGVPFYVNCEVWLNGTLLGVADVWLVGRGTGGELDSREWHEEDALLDATLLRDKGFSRATLSLDHITPARFRKNPAAFVEALFAEADRRTAAGIGEPAGLELRPRGPLLS